MKIFLTVGHQMPFDRLTSAVNQWYADNSSDEVYGQVGETELTNLNFDHTPRMPPVKFREYIRWADLVVSHAGMGTIISAMELATPVLVLARKSSLSETRNDHQSATAKRLTDLGLIQSISDVDELSTAISAIGNSPRLGKIQPQPSDTLVTALSDFISSEQV